MEFKPLTVDIATACSLLSVSRSKLYELVQAGHIPITKIGRKSVIRVEVIEKLAVSGTPQAGGRK